MLLHPPGASVARRLLPVGWPMAPAALLTSPTPAERAAGAAQAPARGLQDGNKDSHLFYLAPVCPT